MSWRFDPLAILLGAFACSAYVIAVARYHSQRARSWPRTRTAAFLAGIVSGLLAIESPLDSAAEVRFAPHMWQHIILTDLAAPLLLLGAPLLLTLGVVPAPAGRHIVAVLRSRLGRALTFPLVGWSAFILSLWIVHFSGFFEAALDDARLHVLEHGIYLGTALFFWLPIIAIGPTPWARGPLAFPLRMLYLFVAMPAEGMLGFSIGRRDHVDRRDARDVRRVHVGRLRLGDPRATTRRTNERAASGRNVSGTQSSSLRRRPSAFVPVK